MQLNTNNGVPSVGEEMTIIGFGSESTDEGLENRLREAIVPVFDQGECAAQFDQIYGVDVPAETMVCAGGGDTDR